MGILFSHEAVGPVHEILIFIAYAPIPQLISIICVPQFFLVYTAWLFEAICRVKSGKFGHQVNSDTHMQTV